MLSMPPATTMSARPRVQPVVGQHHGLHARAAHLVHGRGRAPTRASRRPARAWRAGAWPWPAGSTQPISTSLTSSGCEAGARHRRLDRRAAELRRGQRRERALERAHGRAGRADDDDGVFHCLCHGSCLLAIRRAPAPLPVVSKTRLRHRTWGPHAWPPPRGRPPGKGGEAVRWSTRLQAGQHAPPIKPA